jgi:hypothetical protein
VDALLSNTTASENTAIGAFSLQNNTTGGTPGGSGMTEIGPNTAIGAQALFDNTTGGANTALGFQALGAISTAGQSTAVGFKALANSSTASNDAFGYKALASNTTGGENTACGANALFSSTTGGGNTALGNFALLNNTTGITNTAVGFNAGFGITTADNVIVIGTNVAGQNVDHSCFIGEIFGQTSSNGSPVFINSAGRLGTATSSRRFKEAIKPMEQASETLFSLKPVTFRYKQEIDPAGTSQFGLVAEDVEKVDPALVVRDKENKPYSVRYDQVNAMLLNEFLKEHRKVEKQQTIIAELKSILATLSTNFEVTATKQQKEIQALTAGLQKVSAQVGMNALAMKVTSSEQATEEKRNDKCE